MMRAVPLVATLLAGCVAFNPSCPQDKSEIVGEVTRALDVGDKALRTAEAAAGDLVADALLAEVEGAEIALVPAQAFSPNTACGARQFIGRGALSAGDIDALLPGDDTAVLLELTADDLKRVLEHAVALLGTAERFAGFLQVAGVSFSVDCAERAQMLAQDGQSILFPGARVTIVTAGGQTGLTPRAFKVATLASLRGGALGFVDLTRPEQLVRDTQQKPRDLVKNYLQAQGSVDLAGQGRIAPRDTCL